MQVSPSGKPKAFRFVEGLALHPLNPKHYAMTVSAFAQFADPNANSFTEILIFITTFTCGAGFFHSLWCFAGESFMKMLRSPAVRHTVNISMVVLMVGATAYALYK